MNIIKSFKSLTRFELELYLVSLITVVASSFFADNGFLSTIASAVGVTALIFIAKGNVLGQALTVVFSLLYGYISYTFSYYGEMITYIGMSAPAALLSLISWLKHPYKSSKNENQHDEVKVSHIRKQEIFFMLILCLAVTTAFYYILRAFNTANLFFSTISVTTSFSASYLTMRRSPYYALSYAVNDLILIVLWVSATFSDIKYLPMIMCFVMFLFNDLYGFFNWKRMKKRQEASV